MAKNKEYLNDRSHVDAWFIFFPVAIVAEEKSEHIHTNNHEWIKTKQSILQQSVVNV